MKRISSAWFLIVMALGLVLAVGLYHVAKPPERSDEHKPVLPEQVQAALEGDLRVTSSEDGRIAWSMTGRNLAFYADRKVVEVEDLEAWVPVKDGGTMEVTGKSGRYFESTEDFELEKDVVVLLDKAGNREWIMHGNTASYRHGQKAFYMSDLKGTMYSENKENADISGASARYDINARTMRLTKDVLCKWSKGVTLETDILDYSLDTQMASTDSNVLINGKGFRLKGRGLRADIDGKNVVIPNSVNLRLDQGMKGIE